MISLRPLGSLLGYEYHYSVLSCYRVYGRISIKKTELSRRFLINKTMWSLRLLIKGFRPEVAFSSFYPCVQNNGTAAMLVYRNFLCSKKFAQLSTIVLEKKKPFRENEVPWAKGKAEWPLATVTSERPRFCVYGKTFAVGLFESIF